MSNRDQTFTVRLTEQEATAVKAAAERLGCSLSQVMRRAMFARPKHIDPLMNASATTGNPTYVGFTLSNIVSGLTQ